RSRINGSVAVLCLLFLAQTAWTTPAWGADPATSLELAGARVSQKDQTGRTRFIGTQPGRPVHLKRPPQAASPEAFGLAFASEYGSGFGIADAANQLRLIKSNQRSRGRNSLRYQQVHSGVPVFGGELIINLNAKNALLSINGEVAPELSLSVTPTLTPDKARTVALASAAKWHSLNISDLQASEPLLSIYDASLLKPSVLEPSLVWRIEVSPRHAAPIREMILVDAHSGSINLHFNQVHTARNRETHDGGGTNVLPGTLVCAEANAFPGCALADTDVINAHDFAGDTYDFYATMHGRDGIDDIGGVITSTVHWAEPGQCPNAFWDGWQMVYCDGVADGDDVVAHELTHGVTDYESVLFYYYQSGAINESLSDIWGEFIDLTNGKGNDSPGVRWLIGEDVNEFGGAIRDMKTPGNFGDPDKMSSVNYWLSSVDGGGVHSNSAINNKAAYLMTDGDTFNGFIITGIGINKVAKVYYEAQTNFLTSGSDFADLYEALFQGCINLVGTDDIDINDCWEVRNATRAVEMDTRPQNNKDTPMCPYSFKPGAIAYSNDMETDVSEWYFYTLSGTENDWDWIYGYATSGDFSLYVRDIDTASDSIIESYVPVTIPANAYLYFRHAFAFESSNGDYYDGSVVEYATYDQPAWTDIGHLFDDGQGYDGSIYNAFDDSNTLGGRDAFVGSSSGFAASRYDLSSLAGQEFFMSFRMASDATGAGPLGWIV
ncbi:MAG: M4 family metallopeptidase, partial [Deltaproteobacteria bacterium]|nr:M4 family metallopeptidase [Deltaproteobacteria bacterium]